MTGPPAALQQQEPGITFKSELKGQWLLIAVLFLIQVFAFGFPTFALPFVYSGATEEFGWTRQQAVLLASFKFYTSAAAALVVGRLLDIINPRLVIVSSSILAAAAMAGFLVADKLPIYYALGLILGLSSAGLAISINVTVVRSFRKSTGTMLGIVLTGTSIAGMLLPLLIAPLMETIGWRRAMAVLSCCIWVVALPSWFLLPKMNKRPASAAGPGLWLHLRKLGVTRDFWFIFAGAFFVSTVDQSMVQNQVLFLNAEKGLSLDMVKWGSALLAGVGIGAKTLFGWVFDRLSILGIALCYLLLAVSIGLSFSVAGVATMLVFVTFLGVAHAGVIVSGPVLLKQRYGSENLGMNLGIFTLFMSVGFGSGPPIMARMADKSGSYAGAFAFGLMTVLIAAILLYFVDVHKNRSV
jgi:MFS family permease